MERLDVFMARANAAYYATRDPYADFTTAPEISQAFGEILGAWAAVVWAEMGRPDPVLLAEAGPGRGTMMTDALRAIGRTAPDFAAALRLHLVETSPRLRELQARALPGATWHASLDELPPGPLLLLANEFLDALPVRHFVRGRAGWAERFVAEGRFVERPTAGPEVATSEGMVVEVCEPALTIARRLGARLSEQGGAALFLDYGSEHSTTGESLQALRAGRPADPLSEPGSADLTAHVDFSAIRRRGARGGRGSPRADPARKIPRRPSACSSAPTGWRAARARRARRR